MHLACNLWTCLFADTEQRVFRLTAENGEVCGPLTSANKIFCSCQKCRIIGTPSCQPRELQKAFRKRMCIASDGDVEILHIMIAAYFVLIPDVATCRTKMSLFRIESMNNSSLPGITFTALRWQLNSIHHWLWQNINHFLSFPIDRRLFLWYLSVYHLSNVITTQEVSIHDRNLGSNYTKIPKLGVPEKIQFQRGNSLDRHLLCARSWRMQILDVNLNAISLTNAK